MCFALCSQFLYQLQVHSRKGESEESGQGKGVWPEETAATLFVGKAPVLSVVSPPDSLNSFPTSFLVAEGFAPPFFLLLANRHTEKTST